nr:CHAT domain-containing protein [Granulicella sp. L46]
MSVVCILGDDGSHTRRYLLDLQGETKRLLEVYDALPAANRSAILRPTTCQPRTKDELTQALQQSADVLFFSGHASTNPPRFYLLDGSFVSPEDIEELLSRAVARPVFVAFWACNTGRVPQKSRGGPGPQFYLSLSKAGVASVLAMQSTISDRGAILLAQEVFQALGSGDSLDMAAARARSVLLDVSHMGSGDRLDWACPVVWSSGLSGANLQWNTPESELAHLQIANRRARMAREARPYFPSTAAEISSADRCAKTRLCWVKTSGMAADRESWIRLLMASETIMHHYVVAVELDSHLDLAQSLSVWAEELQETLEISNAHGEAFRSALELMRRRPQLGWKQLCAASDILLSLWRPPEYRKDRWFWDPVLQGNMPAIILGETVTGQMMTDGWSIEQSNMAINQQTLAAAYAEAPLVGNALALLNAPVPKASLEALGYKSALTSHLGNFLVHTEAGEVLLASSAQQQFLAWMDDPSKIEGHKGCMKIYGHISFAGRYTPAVRERRLSHCMGAQEIAAARDEVSILLSTYREANRPQAVVSLMKRAGNKLWRQLPSHLLIRAAWAYTVLSDIQTANLWLERSAATDSLEDAWRHGLNAEIHKARGERQEALDDIDCAVQVLKNDTASGDAPLKARRLRAYQQDRARILQYLFYEPAEAAKVYEQLVEEWRYDTDAAIDLATVFRNYSECVRIGHEPGDPEWVQAKEMLEQALALLQDETGHPVYAEIEYEKSRMALREGDQVAASTLLDQARTDALASGHLMLVPICAARKFWKFGAFDLETWWPIEANLTAFPNHGWAVRTVVDGRLRIAKRVADPAVAVRSLRSNLEDLGRNPGFDAGSDRNRIAATAAGLYVLSRGDGGEEAWNDFLKRPWSVEFPAPEEVWRSVPHG